MHTFVMLRHAKSDWSDDGLDDHDRPLAPRGRKAARAMGQALAGAGVRPDLVLCSTALRAVETWQRAAPAFDPAPELMLLERLYLASPGRILETVREEAGEAGTVVVVGHNPGFEILAQRLAAEGEAAAIAGLDEKYPTGAAAVFTLDAPWSKLGERPARLLNFIRPRDLD